MLTLNQAIVYLRQYYPDDLELVGPGEVEHILSGGEYDTTEGAQFIDYWESLNNVATVIALLEFCYILASKAVPKGKEFYLTRGEEAFRLKEDHEALVTIRNEITQRIAKKYGINIDPKDPLLSDEAIRRALTSAEEVDPRL